MRLIAVILLVLSHPLFVYGQTYKTVNVAIGEWPPYMSETLMHKGVACRIISEAFASQGYIVNFDWYPWKRALELTKANEVDATGPWALTSDRQADFIYSDSLLQESMNFFHLKTEAFDWDSMADLSGLLVGGTDGYNYGEEFKRAEENGTLQVNRVTTDLQNFKMLKAKRIQVFPSNLEAGYGILKQAFGDQAGQFTHHPKALTSRPLYLIVSKKNEQAEEIIRDFNLGLRELRSQGTYDQFFRESQSGAYLNR